jgi:cupin 2 domain-containing protein
MSLQLRNIRDRLPTNLESEVFEDLLCASHVRIERIVSQGHSSPEHGWYDQDENEWVLVIEGRACLVFADGSTYDLAAGDYLHIPAHTRHKVAWTDPHNVTIWLAIFYPTQT